MTHYWAFWYALALLSRVPTPLCKRTDDEVAKASLWYYPAVGALLSVLLWALLTACLLYNPNASPALLAAVLLVLWVSFSGALHLDGLADSADAWVGGMGSSERTLAIMKDPSCGPMGVVAIVLVLLVKFAALWAWLAAGNPNWALLFWVPILPRLSLVLQMHYLPYARQQGMASTLAAGASGGKVVGLMLLSLPLLFCAPWLYLLWLVSLRYALRTVKARLGGYTGDTLGATLEIQEALLLLALAL